MTALQHFFENLDSGDLVAALIGCTGAFILAVIYDVIHAPIYPEDYDMPSHYHPSKKESC